MWSDAQNHGRAREEDRLELRDRRELAALADLHDDVHEPRGLALGRELVGDAPVRVVAGLAEPRVVPQLVDLDHHAVDLEGQLRATGAVALAVVEGGPGVGTTVVSSR
ncbi:MAG: hypothetical protein M5U28_24745 [Sandaracinaceae bacterium]|nr:hypothetical protein [Sandaracinaceae bacterium]